MNAGANPNEVTRRILAGIAAFKQWCRNLSGIVLGLWFAIVALGLLWGGPIVGRWHLVMPLVALFIVLPGISYRSLAKPRKTGGAPRTVPGIALFNLCCMLIVLVVLAGLCEARLSSFGHDLYQQGRCSGATHAFETVSEDRFLRCLTWRLGEDLAWRRRADAYCQLGEYEKARQALEVLTTRFPERQADALKKLDRLDTGLKEVASLESMLAFGETREQRDEHLRALAFAWEFKVGNYSRALEVYLEMQDLAPTLGDLLYVKKALSRLKKAGVRAPRGAPGAPRTPPRVALQEPPRATHSPA